jgi:hypothetical protein
MKMTKIIEHGDYKFELTIESKSVHAHSLMSDMKDELTDMTLASEFDETTIVNLIVTHMDKKKF